MMQLPYQLLDAYYQLKKKSITMRGKIIVIKVGSQFYNCNNFACTYLEIQIKIFMINLLIDWRENLWFETSAVWFMIWMKFHLLLNPLMRYIGFTPLQHTIATLPVVTLTPEKVLGWVFWNFVGRKGSSRVRHGVIWLKNLLKQNNFPLWWLHIVNWQHMFQLL